MILIKIEEVKLFLKVFPAASLIRYAKNSKRIILIDLNVSSYEGVEVITARATQAVPKLVDELLEISY